MSLHLVRELDYRGATGIQYLRCLQQDLIVALSQSDWNKVKFLDQACRVLIDRVIAANKDDADALILVLAELKKVYKNMIMECKYEVNSIAY